MNGDGGDGAGDVGSETAYLYSAHANLHTTTPAEEDIADTTAAGVNATHLGPGILKKKENKEMSTEEALKSFHRPPIDTKRLSLQRELTMRKVVLNDVKDNTEMEAQTAILESIDQVMNEKTENNEEVILGGTDVLTSLPTSAVAAEIEKEQDEFIDTSKVTFIDGEKDVPNREGGLGQTTGLSFRKKTETEAEEHDIENPEKSTASIDSKKSDSELDEDHTTENKSKNEHLHTLIATTKKVGVTRGFCKFCVAFGKHVKDNWSTFLKYTKSIIVWWILPLSILANFLYYICDNPNIGGRSADGEFHQGSYSWAINFVIRLSVTFTLAKGVNFILMDFIVLRTGLVLKLCGPTLTMMISQAQGSPIQMIMWGLWNIILLQGKTRWVKHWLFYQSFLKIYSDTNPNSHIISDSRWSGINIALILVGLLAVLKRVWFSTKIGRRNYDKYGERIEGIRRKILLIYQVAALKPDRNHRNHAFHLAFGTANLVSKNDDERKMDDDDEEEEGDDEQSISDVRSKIMQDTLKHNGKSMRSEDNMMISSILGEWEEPPMKLGQASDKSTIEDMLRFQIILDFLLVAKAPFSNQFGLADTRLHCAESAQQLYKDLPFKDENTGILRFDEICDQLCKKEDGTNDVEMARALIRLFRPERDGSILMVDFIKSCDEVYKKLQLVKAAILNASKINAAIEKCVNIVFYILAAVIVVLCYGTDPLKLFVPFTTFFIPFSFLFASASSDFFKGVLLILVRDPYDVGDRIGFQQVDKDSSIDGAQTWFVEEVGLYSTTVRLAATNEVATLNNGSISASRIINAARSPKGTLYVRLKFGINVAYKKIETFHKVVEKYVKDRPREFYGLSGFRATSVEADLGYVAYVVVLSHRESWQNIGKLLVSKAAVASYCLEVSKQLSMRFEAPAMPVNISTGPIHPDSNASNESNKVDPSSPAFDFEKISKLFGKSQGDAED